MMMTVIKGILDELAAGPLLPGDLYVLWEEVCWVPWGWPTSASCSPLPSSPSPSQDTGEEKPFHPPSLPASPASPSLMKAL